jgi:ribonuclease I
MHGKMRKIQLFFSFVAAIAMLLTVGCASSGSLSTATTRISESEKATSIARNNPASTNASVELRTAEDKLAQARLALADKDYQKATRLAEQATVDADYARIKATSDKARKDADQMRQNIQNLRQDLERTSR